VDGTRTPGKAVGTIRGRCGGALQDRKAGQIRAALHRTTHVHVQVDVAPGQDHNRQSPGKGLRALPQEVRFSGLYDQALPSHPSGQSNGHAGQVREQQVKGQHSGEVPKAKHP